MDLTKGKPFLEQAVQSAAHHYFTGSYQTVKNGSNVHYSFELPEEFNNALLDRLNYFDGEMTPKAIAHASKYIKARKFSLSRRDFKEANCALVYSQNLLEFNVEDLTTLRFIRLQIQGHDGDNPEESRFVPIDIDKLLNKLLNPCSQRQLTKLGIDGTGASFREAWIEKLPPFPKLVSLDITGCSIFPSQRHILFKSFPRLHYLNITRAGNNLIGISHLRRLRTLIVTDVNFHETVKMTELFELNNLEVLDISGIECLNLDNARLFSKEKKTIPSLRILDISQNQISAEDIRSILQSHPNLEIIGLHGIPNNQGALDDFSVQVLNNSTLQSGLNAINYYSKDFSRNERRIFLLLSGIQRFMVRELEKQTPDDLRKCLDTLLMLKGIYGENKIADLQVVIYFVMLSRKIELFTPSQLNSIAECAFSTMRWKWNGVNRIDVNYGIQVHACGIFDNLQFLQAIGDVKKAFIKRMLKQLDVTPWENPFFAKAICTLHKFMFNGYLDQGDMEQISKDISIAMKCLHFVGATTIFEYGTRQMLDFITHFEKWNEDANYKRLFFESFWKFIKRCDATNAEKVLVSFSTLKFVEDRWYGDYLRRKDMDTWIMLINTDELLFESIYLLVQIWRDIQLRNGETFETSAVTPTLEIIQAYFALTDKNDTDELEVFHRILNQNHVETEVIAWTQWFLSLFEEEAEEEGPDLDQQRFADAAILNGRELVNLFDELLIN